MFSLTVLLKHFNQRCEYECEENEANWNQNEIVIELLHHKLFLADSQVFHVRSGHGPLSLSVASPLLVFSNKNYSLRYCLICIISKHEDTFLLEAHHEGRNRKLRLHELSLKQTGLAKVIALVRVVL